MFSLMNDPRRGSIKSRMKLKEKIITKVVLGLITWNGYQVNNFKCCIIKRIQNEILNINCLSLVCRLQKFR